MVSKEHELDYKLAKDIASIRILAGDNPSSTMSDQVITAMKELDAKHEIQLKNQIEEMLKDETSSSKIYSLMTKSYVQNILLKLSLRSEGYNIDEEKKRPKKFTVKEYTDAAKLNLETIGAAVEIIEEAIKERQTETVININAAEVYSYNLELTRAELLKYIPEKIRPAGFDIKLATFAALNYEAIECTKKFVYYGKWMYERYQPRGVIKVIIQGNYGQE